MSRRSLTPPQSRLQKRNPKPKIATTVAKATDLTAVSGTKYAILVKTETTTAGAETAEIIVPLAAAEAHRMTTKNPPHAVTQAVTRVGGEAEAAMMTAATHVVTEEQMATTIEVVEEGARKAALDLPIAATDPAMTVSIEIAGTETAPIATRENITVEEMMTATRQTPSVTVHLSSPKTSGIDARSSSSSLRPASEPAN
jgi:hypothetical protein